MDVLWVLSALTDRTLNFTEIHAIVFFFFFLSSRSLVVVLSPEIVMPAVGKVTASKTVGIIAGTTYLFSFIILRDHSSEVPLYNT